jgi:ELWxxDGT repeat protein
MPAKRSLTLALALLLMAAIPARASSLPIITVVDLLPGSDDSYAMDGGTTGELGGYLYFQATDATNGMELWRTNGTSTELVRDIRVGSNDSSPSQFAKLDNYLYFLADDGVNGRELWRTNGTASGTTLVANINTGSGGADSSPRYFEVLGGYLYFQAENSTSGREIFRTNGTTTELVEDINVGAGSSNPNSLTTFGGYVYFQAEDSATGPELWRTNGTTTEMVDEIRSGLSGSYPTSFTEFEGWLYFQAFDDATGTELWRTNGTTTAIVSDINAGIGDSHPNDFTALGGYLYFRATDGITGVELWRTNGTTTELVADFNATGHSSPDEFTLFDGGIFMALTSETYGEELCVLDAIGADKAIFCWDLAMGASNTYPSNLTVLGDYLYLSANNLAGDNILYRIASDRTREVISLPDGIGFDCDSCDNEFTSAGGRLYMTVSGNLGAGEIGYEFAYLIEPSYVLPETNSEGAPISQALGIAAALTAVAGAALRRKELTSN